MFTPPLDCGCPVFFASYLCLTWYTLALDYVYAKVTAITNFVKKLKAAGVQVDGIGTQCHLEVSLIAKEFCAS